MFVKENPERNQQQQQQKKQNQDYKPIEVTVPHRE